MNKQIHVAISAVLLAALLLPFSAIGKVALPKQPPIGNDSKALLTVDGGVFRDLNGSGGLDVYEDWREPADRRAGDLLRRMSREEKAGMMLIQTLRAGPGGELTENASRFVEGEHMSRFIFRNPVVPAPDPQAKGGFSGVPVTPSQAARFTNAVQRLAEQTRLGIPVVFKSNARNHYEQDARAGINLAAGSFSTWPKEAGLAATRDLDLIRSFAETMRREWGAIGLRGMYGYMADLATEPRWYRVHETFTEDADLAADIIGTLVETLQGKPLGPGGVALTMKHFPGGGPQAGGADPHYFFGREQAYPSGNFDYHLKPFRAAIDAGVSSVMPYYGIPVGQPYEPNDVGMAFSRGIVSGLLRDELGFSGYVNSDTGIIGPPGANRAWGLEGQPIDVLLATAINAGSDVLSGFNDHRLILNLLDKGMISEERLDASVLRLLREQFELGLFENPYVDVDAADAIVGNAEHQALADEAQRRSIVLLENPDSLLPLATSSEGKPIALYTLGIDADAVRTRGYQVTVGDADGAFIPPAPDARYGVIRVTVKNRRMPLTDYPDEPSPIPGRPPSTFFGGALPDEIDLLSFSAMASAKSWEMSPTLDQIQTVMNALGPENVVVAVYFRQPYVLDDASGLKNAGALLALFGADDAALMDVLTGAHRPAGKLPFALPRSLRAVRDQAPDAPGYPPEDTLYPFGYGATYP